MVRVDLSERDAAVLAELLDAVTTERTAVPVDGAAPSFRALDLMPARDAVHAAIRRARMRVVRDDLPPGAA